MYCQKCGNQIDDGAPTCPHCGYKIANKKPLMSTGIVILWLILFFPVGLYFMWAKTDWAKAAKVCVSVFFALMCIGTVLRADIETPQSGTTGPSFGQTQNTANTQSTQNTLSAEQLEQEYQAACVESDYNTLARNPDNYKGQKFVLTGEVVQVQESSRQTDLRINITATIVGETVFYSDTVYAVWYPEDGADRILEDDVITFWCECTGLKTYTSIFGQKISLPGFTIKYYELVQ